MDPAIVFFGFGVGFLVGLTGMGGGSLMTPLLILLFGIKPVTAIGTDIFYAAITKTAGGWRHLKLKTVNVPLTSPPRAAAGRNDFETHPRHKVAAAGLGATTGFVIGLSSAGSGTVIAIMLITVFRLTPQRVVGTDVFHAAILLWAAGIAHWVGGNVDFGLAGNILLGSIPGVIVGTNLSVKAPQAFLRRALAVVLIASGVTLISKEGDPSVVLPAIGIAAVMMGVLFGAQAISTRRNRG